MAADDDPVEGETAEITYCSICKKDFKEPKLLKSHHRREHRDKTHVCTVKVDGGECGEVYVSFTGLQQHIQRIHQKRDLACDVCGATFMDNRGLGQHMEIHDRRPHLCEQCKQCFTTSEELDTHICSKSADSLYAEEPEVDKEKPFRCLTCDKRWKDLRSMNEHLKAHTGWNCDKCDQKCTSKKKLQDHKKQAHGAGSVKCQRCNQEFVDQPKLNKHLQKSACQRKWDLVQKQKASRNKPSDDDESEEPPTGPPQPAPQSPETQQPVTMRDLLGPTIDALVQGRLAAVQGVVRRSLYLALPETPDHVQQSIVGRNLELFRDAQYADATMSLRNPVFGQPSQNLARFLELKKRRQLYAQYIMDKSSGKPATVRVMNYQGVKKLLNHEEHIVDVSDMGMDLVTVKEFAKQLRAVLERVPTYLYLLSRRQKLWVERAALRLTRDNNPGFNLSLKSPSYQRSGSPDQSFVFDVDGFDPAKNNAWRQTVYVPVGSIDLRKPVNVSAFSHFAWYGRDNMSEGQRSRKEFSQQQLDKTKLLAQYLAARSYGFLGTRIACLNEAATTIREFWSGPDNGRCPKAVQSTSIRPWQGGDFFVVSRTQGFHTFIRPTPLLTDSMSGAEHAIIVDSLEAAKVYPVVRDMLEALKAGWEADDVWGIGCARADYENRNWGEEAPIVSCKNSDPDHGNVLHACPDCLRLVKHNTMKQDPAMRSYAICSFCWTDFDSGSKDSSTAGGIFGYHLLRLLRTENEHSMLGKSDAELKKEHKEIWDALMSKYHKGSDQYEDAYVAQLLRTGGAREIAWDGTKLNPLYPSFEAFDPVTEGPDSKTGYHVKHNIGLTGDSINRAKKHYPPIVLHAVRTFQEALERGDKAMYESAVALFKIALVNHYVYGPLGYMWQTSRIGKDLPADFDKIKRSFREPVLLDQNVSDEHLFRYVSQPLKGKQADRARWKHQCRAWLYAQLEMIAVRVFGPNYDPTLRRLWLRGGVFFPFSSEYSIVPDWSEWDLFNWLAVRAHRNMYVCQAPHARKNPIREYTTEELFLTIANLWLRMLKKDLDNKVPDYACGMDETRLVPQPTINSLLCASIGHRYPGQEEHLGLENFDINSDAEVIFKPDDCWMCYETQFCNFLKFKYAVESLPDKVFPQISRIRVGGTNHNILPQIFYSLSLGLVPDPFKTSGRIGKQSAKSRPIPRFSLQAANALQKTITENSQTTKAGSRTVSSSERDDDPGTPSAGLTSWVAPDTDVIMTGQDLIPQPPAFVDNRRNMSNLGASCYADSIIQTLCNVPEFRDVLLAGMQIKTPSGRPPTVLQTAGDEEGQKHMAVYGLLADLCRTLTIPGSRLSVDECATTLAPLERLTNVFRMNVYNEASFFYGWLTGILNVVTDQSEYVAGSDVWEKHSDGTHHKRHGYTLLELANFEQKASLEQDKDLKSLAEHTRAHWQAYLASGNHSVITELSTVQLTSLYQCCSESCPTVEREISYANSVFLRIAPALKEVQADGTIPLRSLIKHNFQEQFTKQSEYQSSNADPLQSRARSCVNVRHKIPGAEKGEYLRKVSRVTRAPQLFVVEVNRQTLDFVEESTEYSELFVQEAERNIHLQRISDYRHLNMEDWCKDAPELEKRTIAGQELDQQEDLFGDGLDSMYDIIAIVAYSYEYKHYTVFIKDDNDDWMYFNDLDDKPVYRDPFTDWPESFVEHMLCFRRDEADTGAAASYLATTKIEPLHPPATAPSMVDAPPTPVLDKDSQIRALQAQLAETQQKLKSVEETTKKTQGGRNIVEEFEQMLQSLSPSAGKSLLEGVTSRFYSKQDEGQTRGDSPQVESRERRGVMRRVSQDMLSKFGLGTKQDVSQPATPTKGVRSSQQDTPTSRTPRRGHEDPTKEGFFTKAKRRLSGDWTKLPASVGERTGESSVTVHGGSSTPPRDAPATQPAETRESSIVSQQAQPAQQISKTPSAPPKSVKRREGPPKRPSIGEESAAKRSRPSLHQSLPQDPADLADIVTGTQVPDPFTGGPRSKETTTNTPRPRQSAGSGPSASSRDPVEPTGPQPPLRAPKASRISRLLHPKRNADNDNDNGNEGNGDDRQKKKDGDKRGGKK